MKLHFTFVFKLLSSKPVTVCIELNDMSGTEIEANRINNASEAKRGTPYM